MWAVGYVGCAVVANVVFGAWQTAMLAGPAYAKRREHEARCRLCEPPSFMWAGGLDYCSAGPRHPYPFLLSPWARLLVTLFWPFVGPMAGLSYAKRALANRMAARIAAAYIIEQDRREVEKLVSEL